jgi:nitrate reductase NapD
MNEIYVASCLMHVDPRRAAAIAHTIAAQQLAEMHASDARGRIVVVLEETSGAAVVEAIDRLRALPGVFAVNLVYQHAEDEAAMREPMS